MVGFDRSPEVEPLAEEREAETSHRSDVNESTTNTCADEHSDTQPSVNTISPNTPAVDMNGENMWIRWWNDSFRLFDDDHARALEDDYGTDQECKRVIYENIKPCEEHHQQLLDALQLGAIDNEDGVFRTRLDHTLTRAGRYTLCKWLEHPLYNTEDICIRRKMREMMLSTTDTTQALRLLLGSMEGQWKSLCWCWNDDPSKTELVEGLMFTGMLAPMNNIPVVVNVYHFMRVCGTPLLHCMAPLVPVLLSYGALRWMGAEMSLKECWDMSTGVFKNALWFDNTNTFSAPLLHTAMRGGGGNDAANGLGSLMRNVGSWMPKIMKSLKWVWWAVFLINIIMMVYQCYRHYKLLTHVYRRTHQACVWIHHAQKVVSVSNTSRTTQEALELLGQWAQTASPEFSICGSAFDFLHAYLVLRQPNVVQACKTLMRQVGVIDALQSIDILLNRDTFTIPVIATIDHSKEQSNTLVSESKTTTDSPATDDSCDAQQPLLEMTDAYHPILGSSQTTHSLSLQKHIVLTGSNASGKSTVLKTMLLNVLLAQSWGVVCAKHMRWTPFANIRGYLHTIDDCGKESLFQAQIRRIEEFIQEAKQNVIHNKQSTHTPKYSLLVVDEILNSTNPIEAMLLSYQYARTIGSQLSSHCRMIMTTHYPVLTTLADRHPEFANWAMQKGFHIGVNKKCKASSAIGTVKQMTKVLGKKEHACLDKAYKRMFKKLERMHFDELDGQDGQDQHNSKKHPPICDTTKTSLQSSPHNVNVCNTTETTDANETSANLTNVPEQASTDVDSQETATVSV